MSIRKTGSYHQQPGHTFSVSVVGHEQQAGQSSPAHAAADAGEIEHLCWFELTTQSGKV